MEEVGFPSQAMDSERNGRRCECGTEGLDADRSPRTTDDIKTASFVASSWATAVCPDYIHLVESALGEECCSEIVFGGDPNEVSRE